MPGDDEEDLEHENDEGGDEDDDVPPEVEEGLPIRDDGGVRAHNESHAATARARGKKEVDRKKTIKTKSLESKVTHEQWGEIVAMIRGWKPARSPHEIEGIVTRVEPGPAQSLGRIDGAAIQGSTGVGGFTTSPRDACFNHLISYFHARCDRNATYSVDWVWKNDARLLGRTTISLPPISELEEMGPERAYGVGGRPQPNYGPQYGQRALAPRGGFGGAPPYGGGYAPDGGGSGYDRDRGGSDPYVLNQLANLRAEIPHLLAETLRSLGLAPQQGQAAAQPAAPLPAPAGTPPIITPPSVDSLVDAVCDRLGVKRPPPVAQPGVAQTPQAAAAVPVTPAPADPVAQLTNAIEKHVEDGVKLKRAMTRYQAFYTPEAAAAAGAGFGGEAIPEATAQVIEEPKPEDNLPFEAIPIGDVKMFGQQAHYVVKKDPDEDTSMFTDALRWAQANPGAAEVIITKGMGILGKIGDAVADAVKTANTGVGGAPEKGPTQPKTEVVDETPRGAVNAGRAEAEAPPPVAGSNGAADWP